MNYQLIYIIPLKYTEKEVPEIIKKINELIKNTGNSVIVKESWAKRKIAYPIKQNRHGYFVSVEIKTEPENIPKINQNLNNLPETLRHSIVKFKPGSFNPTKKARTGESSASQSSTTKKKISGKVSFNKKETLKQDKKDLEIKENIELSPKETDAKKDDKSKIALEDLDKKLEEILANDNIKT